VDLRKLNQNHIEEIWEINEQGLPGTGKVSKEEIARLLDYSDLAFGAFLSSRLIGFVICLPPKTEYGSLNYAWFNDRYSDFLYVDRIAVSKSHQNKGVGSVIYSEVIQKALELKVPVTAEVNLSPPNPGSVRFHLRHGFKQVDVYDSGEKKVAMMVYDH